MKISFFKLKNIKFKRVEQTSNDSNGKKLTKLMALGCSTECSNQKYENTGLKVTCCTKNHCNLPKKNKKIPRTIV